LPRNDAPSAAIFGCAGLALTDEEKRFYEGVDPLGFILFARNVESPEQIRELVTSLRETVGRDAPVLIDQEGGRVQRLKLPHWRPRPAMEKFGRLAEHDLPLARRAARLNAHLIAAELKDLGIDVDCAPLIDVPVAGADNIIGDRAFGADPALVADLGRAVMDGLLDGGVMPIVKHIPGHGRAMVDSHKALPVVETDRATLEKSDFATFRSLRDAPWAMTAHVIYSAYDDRRPATLSPPVIEQVIRGFIGCEAVLLSDDLSMHALSGSFADRARDSLSAGCDVVLHCNGKMDEMLGVAEGLSPLDDAAQLRLAVAEEKRRLLPLVNDAQDFVDAWLKEKEA
jgi:beta-N-acetylhexosaminidase